MPYPNPPEIQTSYTAAEQALGNGTLPGQELDVDLASVRASITAIIEFLKTSLRADGRLANGSVSSDTLASSLIIGFDPPAPWATATAYTTRSTVFEGFGFYLCTVAHTSGTFATDLASGRWVLLADLTPPGGALIAANNLSDVPDKVAGRAALGLGTLATANSGTGAADHRTNSQNEATFQPLAATLTAWAALTRASGFDAFVANPTSANLRALLTDETGTGAALFAGGAMGTPSSLVLINATGLTTSGIAASTLVTASEAIAGNNNDTTIPTSAAVLAHNITLGTAVATTSGTSVEWTTIPSWAKRVTLTFAGVSLSGTDSMLVQVGNSGGYITTGYVCASLFASGTSSSSSGSTSGFFLQLNLATRAFSGSMTLTLHASGEWMSAHNGSAAGGEVLVGGGRVSGAGTVDRVRVVMTGSNTFDAGSVNISWE